MLGVGVDGRLLLTIRLRDGLVLGRLRIEGIDDLGAGRLILGDELRLRGAGIARCGVGREIDRDGDRLGVGADRVLCLLAWLLLLRELRREDPASAAKARSRTATTNAARTVALELEVFFTRYILDLLSPATRDSPSRITAGFQHAT